MKVATPKETTPSKEEADASKPVSTSSKLDKTASVITTTTKTITVDPTIKDSKIASSRTESTKATDVVKGTKIEKKAI